jgi:hypothetical protein
MFVSQACFDLWAVKGFTNRELSFCFEKPSRLSKRHFKSLFLYSSREVAALWATLDKRHDFRLKHPEQLLWGLYYLKVYSTWDQMAVTTGTSEKTLRKWVGDCIDYIASIDEWVRSVQYNSSILCHCYNASQYVTSSCNHRLIGTTDCSMTMALSARSPSTALTSASWSLSPLTPSG